MPEFVVIRLGREPERQVDWIVVDENGTRRSPPQAGTLSEAATMVRGRPVIVLVPATDTVSMTVQLPIRSKVKLQAALPFALEEQLAEDVETLHFAAGEPRESGRRPVAVVARAKMDAWLELLESADIQPWQIIPEHYGVARIPGTISMLVEGEFVMVNDGADNEFVMEASKPSDALVAAGLLAEKHDEDAPPSGHLVVWCGAQDEERLSHDWIALRHELHSVDVNLLPDGALPRLAVTVGSGQGVNLLQGSYGPKADYGSYLRPWRNAAVLLIGLLVATFAATGADVYRLSQEEATLKEQFAAEFQAFQGGNAVDVLDPVGAVASIKRGLGATSTPQVFLSSLEELSAALEQNEAASVESLSYRAGVVDIRVIAPDVATLDNIQRAVSASGKFVASIQSTDQVANKINSRIQIREAGS